MQNYELQKGVLMSNSFRQSVSDTELKDNINLSTSTQKPFVQTNTKSVHKQKKRGKRKKGGLGMYFSYLFNGKILKMISSKKNWSFIAFIFILLILLGYNSLSYKSKQVKINKLNEQITFRKDEVMNMKEEFYNIDYNVEKQLEEEALAEGFNLGGYIPFVIKSAENKKEK